MPPVAICVLIDKGLVFTELTLRHAAVLWYGKSISGNIFCSDFECLCQNTITQMQTTLQLLDFNGVPDRRSRVRMWTIYAFITLSQNIFQHQAVLDQELPEQEVVFFFNGYVKKVLHMSIWIWRHIKCKARFKSLYHFINTLKPQLCASKSETTSLIV